MKLQFDISNISFSQITKKIGSMGTVVYIENISYKLEAGKIK